ncbi:pyrophosphate--fructose-6-phosphate 1-phosphotransferase [Marinitoga sp. 1135]|uniref:Pyrophosphate--fructose 6-phosphate 1-phosphotransferase n=1 Tax=Marinitoga piezophila (strain DSM 14283 / JCM 11233 / KA3) TaxID=443254 RepID=H2J4N3_MARPK|nr:MULTISPECIES: ATP-dependent 6-phosphofructokinase [Marinitoga]AEX85975.1 phosphofructokinase [Marinitoga piezophila KA3]APT76399.1 pyrophosphate--fructose-6-phosphate 1-phosphotransferase [Marinitoga sp. 1137]NUU96169.1 pyrophosphate--fructose-6-phosphate 1-phosphotransferase [Marinitoga sp. 1135]NUU98077.1 pyrophosphate--fructose-6-phosphate 1-phosphotransferase [Marinitoga sp. 1138]
MRIGILTGGGDCPGLNAVIRGIVRSSGEGYEIYGVLNGWKGMLSKDVMKLDNEDVEGIHILGGTILGTARVNPFKREEDRMLLEKNFKELGFDALIAIGGDDTLSVAAKLSSLGYPVVGVPKTIDNDVSNTDYTFGFHTAVNVGADAIDRLHSTAKSHQRVMIVELMGREAGWITIEAGLAAGAHLILIPEFPMTINEIVTYVNRRMKKNRYMIIAVAEGFKPTELEEVVADKSTIDAFGHIRLGGVAHYLAEIIEQKTGYETRSVVLGHLLRGGTPTAFDRILGTRYGVEAMNLVKKRDFGRMVALKGNEIISIPLEYGVATKKLVPFEYYKLAQIFFD